MSKSSNALFRSDIAFLDYLRSTQSVLVNGNTITRRGKRGERDLETVIEAVFCQFLLLTDPSSTIGVTDLRCRHWASYVLTQDIAVVVDALSDVFEFTTGYETSVRRIEYEGFKRLFSTDSGLDLDLLLDPISDTLREFLQTPNPMDFSVINEFCHFLGRLNLPSLDYLEQSLASYEEVEYNLSKLSFSERTPTELNLIIREWFSDFRVLDFSPTHAGGGVAHKGRCSKYDKYKSFWLDSRLQYFLHDHPDWASNIASYLESHAIDTPLHRVAELQVVSKNIKKNRTICMEDCTLQYFQKGIDRDLRKYIQSPHRPNFRKVSGRTVEHYGMHALPKRSIDSLRDHINFNDQGLNRQWSQIGSYDESYATVDMKNASDTVSLQLVKPLFKGTALLRYIICTRSDEYLLPDGTIKKFLKVYPSGSALCFAIETIVFTAICELAVRRSGLDRTHNEFRVYGDDIVIRPVFIGYLLDILTELGFTTNSSKSYWSGNFRESCGGEYYKGTCVTPLRISRNFAEVTRAGCPGAIDNRIEFANRCAVLGYQRLRRYLITDLFNKIREFYPSSRRPNLPLMIDNVKFLYSPEPTNFHLSKSYNSDLQCEDIYYGASRSSDTALGAAYVKQYRGYREALTKHYSRVRQLIDQGYLFPDAIEYNKPVEQLPLDYDDYRYQLWIDLSSTRTVRYLDYLDPDNSSASIRTSTKSFGRSTYHNS